MRKNELEDLNLELRNENILLQRQIKEAIADKVVIQKERGLAIDNNNKNVEYYKSQNAQLEIYMHSLETALKHKL